MLALASMKSEGITGDAKAKVDGMRRKMSKIETFFGVLVCSKIFGPCEDIPRACRVTAQLQLELCNQRAS
jgi:hypothetical protein